MSRVQPSAGFFALGLRFILQQVTDKKYNRFEKCVFAGEKSLRFVRTSSYNPSVNPDKIERRGAIYSFSRHAALRLRRSLSELHVAAARAFGVTLTLPWLADDFRLDVPGCLRGSFGAAFSFDYASMFEEYKAAFNRFGVAFRRMFPHSAAIFRHELQKRRVPHCHLVIYFSNLDLPFVSDSHVERVRLWIRERMYQLWQQALLFDFKGGDVEGFYRHGICVQALDDLPAMFRYIGDHTSKKKQAQLGYKGKQWGFLNRHLFVTRMFSRFDFASSEELVLFSRTVTKLCRFKVTKRSSRVDEKGARLDLDCSFGSKLSPRRKMSSVHFVDFSSAKKIFDWIIMLRSPSDWIYVNYFGSLFSDVR